MADADQKLVNRILEGDESAFAELVSRYGHVIMAIIRREVSDQHDCEDVIQETLLQAWRDIGGLRDGSRLKPWLVSVARNRCRDFRKAGRDEKQVQDVGLLETGMTRLGRDVMGARRPEELTRALQRVPATQRATAQMFYIDGLTIREIAARLKKAQGTVKSRLFHARRALRESLGPEAGPREE